MNLADITTKCYILALIIRDDGERLLLGDGDYEFKDSQQHFIANTYANDVVELQGTDGQMLAGQVRRTSTQTFAGYIGDATFSKQKIETARRNFLMFFRKKHYYTAVYIFSDGTAIQRDRGYIVNAPSAPELYQRFPEWSIGLSFEDPNYYEYAEDDLGQEIAAHKVELELATAVSGGLIWDGDGAVSDDLSYVGTEIQGEGKNFQLADTGTATLKSAELLGDAEQTTYSGKNLFGGLTEYYVSYCTYTLANNILTITPADTTHNPGVGFLLGTPIPSGATVHLSSATSVGSSTQLRDSSNAAVANFGSGTNTTKTLSGTADRIVFNWLSTGSTTPFTVNLQTLQIEVGSTATAYEPYVGGTASPNPDYPQAVNTVTGEQTVKIEGKNLFDKNDATDNTGLIWNTANTFAENKSVTSGFIPVKITQTYTSSHFTGVFFYDANKVYLGALQSDNTSIAKTTGNIVKTFTVPNIAEIAYTRLSLRSGSNGGIDMAQQDIQLELGSTATAYEPYQGQTKPVNLGKNLFDLKSFLTDRGVTYTEASDGTITFTSVGALYSQPFQFSQDDITVSIQGIISNLTGSNFRIQLLNKADIAVAEITPSTTTREDFSACKVRFNWSNSGTFSAKNIQIELGSQATSYAPVLVTKNLFNKSTVTNGYRLGSDGTPFADASYFLSDYIEVLPNTAYIASPNSSTNPASSAIAIYDASKTFIRRILGANWKATFTTDANAKYIRLTTLTSDLNTTQFEIGSVATPYEPYGTPYELAKIGDYQDRIYKSGGKWYIEKKVGKRVFNGTEPWSTIPFGTNTWALSGLLFPFDTSKTQIISNIFRGVSNDDRSTAGENIIYSGSTNTFYIRNTSLTSLESVQSATSGNYVYYALATPTTTEITNSELVGQLERLRHAHTYADLTNFSITTTSPNLPAFLKVVAFGDDAIPQGGYVWEDGGTGGATTITVDGVDNAQPIWTVVGPATNPSLTNITTGESIQWTGVVPNGQTLVVNMADMTASLSGANVFEFISGSWITLQAGNNRVSYSAVAATGIATLEWNGVVG